MNPNDIAAIRERMHSRKIKVTEAQKRLLALNRKIIKQQNIIDVAKNEDALDIVVLTQMDVSFL
jgi:hypothetical protein